MAEAVAFDTHRFVKHLTQEGFTLGQAEALAEEQVNFINSNLATKADIAAVKAHIATVEATLKADMAALKVDLLKWMFGALIAQGGLIVALVKLL